MNPIVFFSCLALPFTSGALARDIDSSFVESAASSSTEILPGPGSSIYNCRRRCDQKFDFNTDEWWSCYDGCNNPRDATTSNVDPSFVESAVSDSSERGPGPGLYVLRCTHGCDQALELGSPEWENCYNCCNGISSSCNQGDTADSNIDSSFVENAASDSSEQYPTPNSNPCFFICNQLASSDVNFQQCLKQCSAPRVELQANFNEKDNIEGEDSVATPESTGVLASDIDSYCEPDSSIYRCRNICDQTWLFVGRDEWLACYDCCREQSSRSPHSEDATSSFVESAASGSSEYVPPGELYYCYLICRVVGSNLGAEGIQQCVDQNCPGAVLQTEFNENDSLEGDTADSNIDSSFVDSSTSDFACIYVCAHLAGPDLSFQQCIDQNCPGAALQTEFNEIDNLESDTADSNIDSSFVDSSASDSSEQYPSFNPCYFVCARLVGPDLTFQQCIDQNCFGAALQTEFHENDSLEGEDTVATTHESTRASEPKPSLRGAPLLQG